jgi:hypothetical protein
MKNEMDPPAIVKTSVSELIAAGKRLHDGLKRDERAALEKAIQLGAIIDNLKQTCAHGEYLPALAKIGVPQQRASEFRRLAKVPTSVLSGCESLRDALTHIADVPDAPPRPVADPGRDVQATGTASETPASNKGGLKLPEPAAKPAQTRAERVGQTEPTPPRVMQEREPGDDTESEAAARREERQQPKNGSVFDWRGLESHFGYVVRGIDGVPKVYHGIEQTEAFRKAREALNTLARVIEDWKKRLARRSA